MLLMVLLGDVGHVESCFGPFGDSVRVRARLVHGLCQTYIGSGVIWTHPMVLFLILMQDWCTIWQNVP